MKRCLSTRKIVFQIRKKIDACVSNQINVQVEEIQAKDTIVFIEIFLMKRGDCFY